MNDLTKTYEKELNKIGTSKLLELPKITKESLMEATKLEEKVKILKEINLIETFGKPNAGWETGAFGIHTTNGFLVGNYSVKTDPETKEITGLVINIERHTTAVISNGVWQWGGPESDKTTAEIIERIKEEY